MSKIYITHRRPERPAGMESRQTGGQTIGNQSMEALMTGAQAPSAENLGHQMDLPGAIREKMESAFGADLSGVQLYESQAVADAGAQAITMGNKIGFAPGQLDLASSGGQSLLGHELSHVVSQARGEVSGNGFLNDHALEARADREGAMATAGESVYSGLVTPLSASSVTSAAGPMQAKKPRKKDKAAAAPEPEMEEFSQQLHEQAQGAYENEKTLSEDSYKAYLDTIGRATGAESREDAENAAADLKLKSVYHDRYLQRHLLGKNEAEQDDMFKAFSDGGGDSIAQYLAADISGFMEQDFSDLDSEDDATALAAYERFAPVSMNLMSISDLIGHGHVTAGQMHMSEEQMEAFNAKKKSLADKIMDERGMMKMQREGTALKADVDRLRAKRAERRQSGGG